MKVLFIRAADKGETRLFQPITSLSPAGSISKIAAAAFELQGRCAPTRAHAMPSRRRYWARVLTSAGMEARVTECAQLQSWPVAPSGSTSWSDGVVLGVILKGYTMISYPGSFR